ncbi:MAG: UDP-N-acetylmuramate--L-alanine ligase [Phycisphaerae bacterium]
MARNTHTGPALTVEGVSQDGAHKIHPAEVYAGRKFHFIGAGGIGMSGLAKLMLHNQSRIAGSDAMAGITIEQLNSAGAKIRIGHTPNLDDDVEAVVISAAVTEDNAELQAARARGLKVYKYAQMLGELFNGYDGIAISGTHGKSTTSGWLAFVLREAGLEPTFIVGADIPQLGSNSGAGDGTWFVAEACEYDRSFLCLSPRIGTILNIEQDHLDYYKDEAEIVGAFAEFAKKIRPGGVLVANGQDKNLAGVLKNLPENIQVQTFGLDKKCVFYADNIVLDKGCYGFDVYRSGELLGRVRISLAGVHNIYNALAVIAMASSAGVDAKRILEILPRFGGVDRRMMFKAEVGGVTVLDDYAHHPTEIRASLAGIREKYSPNRLFCVFQPHQYSRARFLLDDFAESFKLADVTVVPDIYFVRDSQQNKEMVNAQKLVERIRQSGSEAVFIDSFELIRDYLLKNVKSGDLIVTMGAGDIWKVSDECIQWLRANS